MGNLLRSDTVTNPFYSCHVFPIKRGSATTEDSKSREHERRCAKRYPVLGKACFEWQEVAGKYITGTGPTRDISARGVFIQTDKTPPFGADIVVGVTLPSLLGDSRKKSLLRGRGTVIRVIPDQGFVVEVTFRIVKVDRPSVDGMTKLLGL